MAFYANQSKIMNCKLKKEDCSAVMRCNAILDLLGTTKYAVKVLPLQEDCYLFFVSSRAALPECVP